MKHGRWEYVLEFSKDPVGIAACTESLISVKQREIFMDRPWEETVKHFPSLQEALDWIAEQQADAMPTPP